jgi:hypothetical protein
MLWHDEAVVYWLAHQVPLRTLELDSTLGVDALSGYKLMKFSSTGLLFSLVCVCSPILAGSQEKKAEASEVVTGAAVLTLQFDDKVITFSGKPDVEIIETTIKKVIERRGIDGLRMECVREFKGGSLEAVPLVGEKKEGYFRFVRVVDGDAVSATKDQGESIRTALDCLGIESEARGDDKE